MSDLTLTEDRRRALLSLLEDEERLRSTRPQLAKYLATAPTLAGTSDPNADAAFELRLAYYLSGIDQTVANPYWAIVENSVSTRDGKRVVDNGSEEGSPRLAFAQTVLQDVFAYSIPTPETVDKIAGFCNGRRVIDLGAGNGYWAALLSRAGIDVAAYDVVVPDAAWHPVQPADHVELDGSNALLLSWPPGWGSTMAVDALRRFEDVGGELLVYIGEPRGGMCASPQFFDRLEESWELAWTDQNFASWWTTSDQAQGWVRSNP